jgi:hypothetical protein
LNCYDAKLNKLLGEMEEKSTDDKEIVKNEGER